MLGAVSPDHDDDDGGDFRHATDCAWLWRGRGDTPAAWHCGGRRAGILTVPDAICNAGVLRQHGSRRTFFERAQSEETNCSDTLAAAAGVK